VFDFCIHKADLARLIVKTEAFEAIPGKVFKPAIDERNGAAVVQVSLAVPDYKWGVLDRHSLSEIGIVGQETAAVAN